MSCILNTPEACDRLAARIVAHPIEAAEAAKLAVWPDYSPARLAAELYRENHRAFYAAYAGRHLEGVPIPSTEIRELPELANAKDTDRLFSSLCYFVYQCAEGEEPERVPVYRFLRILQGLIALKVEVETEHLEGRFQIA